MGLNWKCPFSTFTYPITYKVGFWYFESLCKRNAVSCKTYQYFRDKMLVRPWSKYPNWQRSQPISGKAKYSHRNNIYLEDHETKITYQNIRGKLRSDRFLYHEMLTIGKKFPYNLHGWAFYKNCKVCFNQERLPITYRNFRHKSLVRPKSKSPNWQGYQPIS